MANVLSVRMADDFVIRPPRPDERSEWEPLWRAYLDFYRTSVARDVYDATWARLHDPNEPMELLGAYVDGRLRGIVHYLFHRSCWTVGDYCYLQDLFVAAEARGRGLGDRKSTRLNSSHIQKSRMPSSA